MAVRTLLQSCLVFAVVGLCCGPVSGILTQGQITPSDSSLITIKNVSALIGSNRAISIESPAPLPASLNQQRPKHNVSLRFLEEPSDLVVVRGQDAVLLCEAKSTIGNVTISWLYEGEPLPEDDLRWTVKGSELRLLKVAGGKKAVGKSNAGDYSCLASNSYGAILSRTVKVKIATMDKEVVAELAINKTIYEGQPILLFCSVHSIPLAEIQWEFNQLPLPKDKRYVPLPNGALLLRNTKFNDTGNYRCVAKNSILKKLRTSIDLMITILKPLQTTTVSPYFLLVNSSINQTVLIGETIELSCVASGWPIPSVQWINYKNVTLSNSSVLTIRNAYPKDSGMYTCIASNNNGEMVQTFQLEVHQKPYFNATPVSSVSPTAKTVRLDCQAKGIPQPKIMWLKNGQPLTSTFRIKKQLLGLVFTETVSSDAGIYQCIAVNEVGRVWTTAQIEINNSHSPGPPQDVKCWPYDDDKICVSWKIPANVSVQAYSVYSSYTNDGGFEVAGPEYLIQDNFQLAHDLKYSTNYSFYVRLYSNRASDHSETVTCQTGLQGLRNLDIEAISSTSVSLKWDPLSSDTLCNGTKDPYVVQWFRDGDYDHLSNAITLEKNFTVSALLPATDYQFRVVTQNYPQEEPWIMYSLPDIPGAENVTLDSSNELRAPKYLHEDGTTSTSTRVSWDRVLNAKFYTVCCIPAKENRECLDDDFVKSYSPKYSITKLKPNTEYVFRVRAYDSNNQAGEISQRWVVRTLADPPSPVIALNFAALNSSTVCIYWRQPETKNGKLKNYIVSYTTDKNWSLEHLIEYIVPVNQKKSEICHEDIDPGLVSTYLTNLSTENQYLVMVRAANDVGVGMPCPPIVVKTYDLDSKSDERLNSPENNIADNQKIGIILGVILALLCVFCCIAFILLRRRCLKRRALARARQGMSSNRHPAVAHYTSQLGTVQVRVQEPCSMDDHEIEHLVSEERSPHIPPVTPDHLDTKGVNDLPNGYVNGMKKPSQLNGNAMNGHVHITENPQFYAFECNGNMAKNKSEPLLRHYEEDSNSNVKPSKFYDFYKIFDSSRKPKESQHHSPYNNSSKSSGSIQDDSLNSTQLTFLNDSINSQRRLSPVLEPNG